MAQIPKIKATHFNTWDSIKLVTIDYASKHRVASTHGLENVKPQERQLMT
jgi:hypothetical protein